MEPPDTVLDDAPRRFADYQPENFDRVFHDKVTAREALAYSLNVPAVRLLEAVGPQRLASRMQQAGATLSSTNQVIAELAYDWSTPEGSRIVQDVLAPALQG